MQVLAALPFDLTEDQKKVWEEIARDMESPLPMRRLVQGDVGSGKTAIALLALIKTVERGCQGALMAPTEILAHQHYDYLSGLLTPLGVRVRKPTRTSRRKSAQRWRRRLRRMRWILLSARTR